MAVQKLTDHTITVLSWEEDNKSMSPGADRVWDIVV
jgi:hypothetical protein